jgi:septum site-determining protein MinC
MGSVDLRMTKRGVVLFIEKYDELSQLFADITNKISQLEGFFAPGDKLSIMMKDKEKYSKDITDIVSFVEEKGFKVGEILVGEMNRKTPNKMSVKQKLNVVESEITKRLNPTKVIKKTIRSGQAVVHDGDVIVMGNLNSGGEIISAGNVMILGEAKGVIRAGVKGSEDSVIYAILMNPELIQIANHVAHLSELLKNAVAHVRGGKVVFENYDKLNFSNGRG